MNEIVVKIPQHRKGYDFTADVNVNKAMWAVCLIQTLNEKMVRFMKKGGEEWIALIDSVELMLSSVDHQAILDNKEKLAKAFVDKFVEWMMDKDLVETKIGRLKQPGSDYFSQGYKLTPLLEGSLNDWLAEAKRKATPLIMPLNEQLGDWKLDGTNHNPLVNWKLGNHDQMSYGLVKCINKLQSVQLKFDKDFIRKSIEDRRELAMKDDDKSIAKVALIDRLIMQGDKPFYTAMKCDDRLRMYYKGMLQPQQMEYVREHMLLSDGTPLVFFDAHCSGIQHIAALFGNEELGKLVNLKSDKKNDFYSAVAEMAYTLVHSRADKEIIKLLGRQGSKLAVLHGIYGASETTTLRMYMNGETPYMYEDEDGKKRPMPPLSEAVAKAYVQGLNRVAPEVKTYLRAMQSLVKTYCLLNPEKDTIAWNLPNGQEVRQRYSMSEQYNLGLYETDGVYDYHWTAEDAGTRAPDAARHERAIAPNFIHSLDAHFLRTVINKCDFEVVAIHDCIGCAEENVDELLRIWTEQFELMYSGYAQFTFIDFVKRMGGCPEKMGLKHGGWKLTAAEGQFMITQE